MLNSVTRKDAYPLPRIDTCLDAMANARWFSTFDFKVILPSGNGESECPMDSDKTAFICPRGMSKISENAVWPVQRRSDLPKTNGCINDWASFRHLSRLPRRYYCLFRDGRGTSERLAMVLKRLQAAGLKLKPEKCIFFQKSVSFLGHMITEDGIGTDPAKIKAVAEWPIPTCLRDVRAFSVWLDITEGSFKILLLSRLH
jgi:hypothetical protein